MAIFVCVLNYDKTYFIVMYSDVPLDSSVFLYPKGKACSSKQSWLTDAHLSAPRDTK